MIYLKTPSQLRELEYVNKIGAEFLGMCFDYIKPGVCTFELEDLAILFCEKRGVKPAFYKYRDFPHLLCVSINEEIIHGFPSGRIIKSGDIVSIDFGVEKDGYISDSAFTKAVGKVSKKSKELVRATKECLMLGVLKAKVGNRLFDISRSIYQHAVQTGFDVVRDFVGHGVGFKLHEEPQVPNYVSFGIDWKLKAGMVLAIEPMLVEGTYQFDVSSNGWTIFTTDNGRSAHFEHSVAITEKGPKILSVL